MKTKRELKRKIKQRVSLAVWALSLQEIFDNCEFEKMTDDEKKYSVEQLNKIAARIDNVLTKE